MVRKISRKGKTFGSFLSLLVGAVMVSGISYLGVRTYQASQAAAAASIYVSPASGSFTAGSTMSVTIREHSGTSPVNSVQVSLNYDSNQLQFVNITEGNAFPVIAATSTNTPGVVRIGRANANTPQTGDQVVSTVNFKVIGSEGTDEITIDKAYSFLVRSNDNKDMLESVGNGTYTFVGSSSPTPPPASPTPPPPSSNGKPVLYISPAGGTYGAGSTISAAIKLNSYSTPTSTVQAVVNYPADKLQYVGVTEGGVYTTQMRTKNTNGTLDIIRGIAGGGDGKQGDNTVVTANFKVLASSGAAALAFAGNSAAYDTSGSGSNTLNLSSSVGSNYTLAAAGTPPPPPPAGSNGGIKPIGKPITTPGSALQITPSAGAMAAIATSGDGTTTELQGEVTLAPGTAIASDGASGISRVEYYLDEKLISTEKTAPFAYKLDTTKMRNGEYVMVVKTYFTNGTVDTRSDKLLVKNKVTPGYVVRQYGPSAVALSAILALCGFLLWKLVIPRLAFARLGKPAQTPGDAATGIAPEPIKTSAPVMPDPLVIAPNAADTQTAQPPQVKIDNAAATTPALPLQPAANKNLEYDATGELDGTHHQADPTVIAPSEQPKDR